MTTRFHKVCRRCLLAMALLSLVATFQPCHAQEKKPATGTAAKDEKSTKEPAVKEGWIPLLQKTSLEGWESTNFGGEGEVNVEESVLTLGMGDPLTGVTWKGKPFPKSNFEIKLEARRLQGNDFLCGLTFPVGDKHASYIAGGWGGGVVGLSSVDGNDASENSTSSFHDFKDKTWYNFRVRVDDENIIAWIDDERVFTQEREGHEFSVRAEVMSNRPLGYCVFQSKVEVRNFAWRPLTK